MALKIEKIERNKYVIIDEKGYMVSCEYITTLKQARKEVREIKEFFKL